MAEVKIRRSRPGDYETIYGEPLRFAIKAYTATVDGEPRGISGVAYVGGQVNAFSKTLPGLPRTAIARGALKVIEMIRGMNCPVLCVADKEIATAPAFLERVGFEHVATNSQGEVYRWRKQH